MTPPYYGLLRPTPVEQLRCDGASFTGQSPGLATRFELERLPWLPGADNFDMVLPKPFPLKKLIDSIRSLAPVPPRAAMGA